MLRIRCALYNGTFDRVFPDYLRAPTSEVDPDFRPPQQNLWVPSGSGKFPSRKAPTDSVEEA
jgi:hypothetical protein